MKKIINKLKNRENEKNKRTKRARNNKKKIEELELEKINERIAIISKGML